MPRGMWAVEARSLNGRLDQQGSPYSLLLEVESYSHSIYAIPVLAGSRGDIGSGLVHLGHVHGWVFIPRGAKKPTRIR